MAKKFDLSLLPARPDLSFETSLRTAGFRAPAGLDEAGRGAWAGPVSAGAVILPDRISLMDELSEVRDSKQMKPDQRFYWAEQIRQAALAWAVGFASSEEIDEMGIMAATRLAMLRALQNLPLPPDHLIIDALLLPDLALPQTALIKGDARSLSIAAASVLAKTSRDLVMVDLDRQFPSYGFARHKGYGTPQHFAALQTSGPCPSHRFCFEPVKGMASG